MTLAELLGRLAEVSRRAEAGESVDVPRATLHVRGVGPLEGRVASVREGRLVLETAGGGRAYLEEAAVAAVVVQDAARHATLLDSGRILPSATTHLELRRRAAELSRVLAIEIEVEKGEVAELARVLEDAGAVLREMTTDDVGREALSKGVARVVLRAKGVAAAARKGRELALAAAPCVDRRKLRREIEALL